MLPIIYLVMVLCTFFSHMLDVKILSFIPYYFFFAVNIIYIALIMLRPQILLKINIEPDNNLMKYFNIAVYFLFVGYYFFISDLKLSTYLAWYMILTYFLTCCVKYYKRHKQ